ncbi:AAA family ATPase [Corynebacterium glyciniphilum]|uniref:AAA family ATPase n=1 Tax=Corynebacterium glyciniphilum TaxID=1404244 RepID=UPI0011AB89E5|nr:AAA family ATPase [Corynebacterium glyciniphilum]
MTTPVLHLLVGPNGAGKSTYVTRVLQPASPLLPFINADVIAAERWPDSQAEHAYEAARIAASTRLQLLTDGRSFIAETVFSHPSKLELVGEAQARGYLVLLHVIMVPAEITLHRVRHRVAHGGHAVPEHKIRERYDRLWPLVAQAAALADYAEFLDNSLPEVPYRRIASFDRGRQTAKSSWPSWTPTPLTSL